MFKKPLGNLKTSAPLRSSDRRKLKQRVVSSFSLTPEEGDLLVPDGILSVKFMTHVEEPGVAYLSADGDPLWFTIGKGAEDLIPTVYTLWKKHDLVPFLSTPSAVVPILINGADLMIPGVIHCPPSLPEHQIVAIRQFVRKDGQPYISPPVAVGWMALPSDELRTAAKEKGKAVHIAHTWKDHLWDMGSKIDIPEDTLLATGSTDDVSDDSEGEEKAENSEAQEAEAPPPPPSPTPGPSESSPNVTYSPAEVTELLNKTLLQAIITSLRSLPASSFPIPATQFYSNYILPCRPAFPTIVLPPPGFSSDEEPTVDTDITIKTSTHKSLTAFLKAAEKASLLTLKPPQKNQPDVLVTSVNATHPNVVSHNPFVTVKDLELKASKKAAREEKERASQVGKEIEVKELWKPHLSSIDVIEGMGGSKSGLYSIVEIRTLVNDYIASHNLVNVRDKAYINLDDLLYSCVAAKQKTKSKAKDPTTVAPEETPQFMKRDELTKNIIAKMQNWYEIKVDGKDPITKKGSLSPIQVVVKVRQGRKASTLITGFEPFSVVDADEMAEDLRKVCAGATSVSPIAGKPAGSGMEVLVQGKQTSAVLEYLMGKGIPKKWIETADLSGKK